MSKTVIGFVLVYLGGVGGALFIDAVFGVYLYQLLYFLNPEIRWWLSGLPDLRFSFIVAICILAGYILRRHRYTTNRLSDIPQAKWLSALIVVISFVSFIAVWPERHLEIYQDFIKLMFFVALAYKLVNSDNKFEGMLWAFMMGNFYIGYVAHSVGRGYTGRLEGVGPADGTNANDMGAVLISSIPLLIFYVMEGRKIWHKGVAALALAYIIDGVVLVNSRGAFLGLTVALLYMSYFVFLKRIRHGKMKLKMAVGLVFGVCLFVYLTDAAFWERMATLKEVEQTQTSEGATTLTGAGADRTYFWWKGIELVQRHPFGVGGWGYMYLSPQFLPKEMLTGGVRAAHSIWIQALTEYGYIGFTLFVGYLVASFRLMRRARKYLLQKGDHYRYYQNVAISAGFVAFLTASTFLDRFYAEMVYWFPMFMACFANIYVFKDTFWQKLTLIDNEMALQEQHGETALH